MGILLGSIMLLLAVSVIKLIADETPNTNKPANAMLVEYERRNIK